MQEEFLKENKIIEKTEIEKEEELIISILKTKRELNVARQNFEYAQGDLIDYYSYQIKENQSKLDYLIKLAKKKGVILSRDKEVKIRMILQKKLVG